MKIFVSIILAFFVVGCSDNTKEETKNVEVNSVTKSVKKTTVEEKIAEHVKAVKKEIEPVLSKTVEAVKEKAQNSIDITKEKVAEVIPKVQKVIADAKTEVKKALSSNDSGKNIFKACAGCHGSSAQNKALGKSQIIQGWSEVKITDALNGYKTGSYGGAMKGVMKAQVSKLSENDINAVAKYISNLSAKP